MHWMGWKRIQEFKGSRIQGVTELQEFKELKNLGFRRRFSRADACPGFSDKDIARIFCNS